MFSELKHRDFFFSPNRRILGGNSEYIVIHLKFNQNTHTIPPNNKHDFHFLCTPIQFLFSEKIYFCFEKQTKELWLDNWSSTQKSYKRDVNSNFHLKTRMSICMNGWFLISLEDDTHLTTQVTGVLLPAQRHFFQQLDCGMFFFWPSVQ